MKWFCEIYKWREKILFLFFFVSLVKIVLWLAWWGINGCVNWDFGCLQDWVNNFKKIYSKASTDFSKSYNKI